MVSTQQLVSIDTEGGHKNWPDHSRITVALVNSSYETLYFRENIPLHSEEFRTMRKDVRQYIGTNVVVAHGVENDLDQVGLKGLPGIRYAQTGAFGALKQSNKHNAVDDAVQHMKLAIANIRKLDVKTY